VTEGTEGRRKSNRALKKEQKNEEELGQGTILRTKENKRFESSCFEQENLKVLKISLDTTDSSLSLDMDFALLLFGRGNLMVFR